jgi:YD repeat-containing protein
VTNYTFDDVGETTAVTDALDQAMRSDYDAAGNLRSDVASRRGVSRVVIL